MTHAGRLIDVIDHPDAERPARPAATALLVRNGAAALEVLMIRRAAGGSFGGMWAFPGGVIEVDDVPPGTAPDPLPAARRAAARETYEEVGLDVDAASLVLWSHWLPPADSLSPKRFSTWFLVAPADERHDDHRVGVDGTEVDDHRWIAPAVAVTKVGDEAFRVAPPTLVTLHELAEHPDVDALLRAADPTYYATRLVVHDDVPHCLWAGGAAYESGSLGVGGARNRVIMRDGVGWRYEHTAS